MSLICSCPVLFCASVRERQHCPRAGTARIIVHSYNVGYNKYSLQLILLFRAQGGFGSPSNQAPFKLSVPPKSEVDAFDEHLQTLILGSESDSVAYIHLPKQLPVEEGGAEVLQWFSETSQELGAGDTPITDTGCVIALS